MKTKIPVVNVRGELRDVRGYNLAADDVGKWAVIQWGYNALSTGETREAAINEAAGLCGIAYDDEGNEIDWVDGLKPWPEFDGDTTVDRVIEAWIDEDENIAEAE